MQGRREGAVWGYLNPSFAPTNISSAFYIPWHLSFVFYIFFKLHCNLKTVIPLKIYLKVMPIDNQSTIREGGHGRMR